ncbi:MAG: IgGFc-binding protein [Paludibacteraceae bacterium]|nr:IgGFc-binding protein [Paludibacteraceae bacterium]
MKRWLIIVCVAWFAAMELQSKVVPGSAGREFYFTVFDHRLTDTSPLTQQVSVGICSTDETYVTVEFGGRSRQYHVAADSYIVTPPAVIPPFTPVHITSTAPCYVNVRVADDAGSAESAILPTHLLGTDYMLQGNKGFSTQVDGATVETYSQFAVVGVADNTSVTVYPIRQIQCVTTQQTIERNVAETFTLAKGEVLFFRVNTIWDIILGSSIHSDKPVAVFQGNSVTQLTSGVLDYVWEQTMPTSYWGTRFVIPMSADVEGLQYMLTAIEDNTEINRWENGEQRVKVGLGSRISELRSWSRHGVPGLITAYIESSKPICCSVYLSGGPESGDPGAPSLTAIVPMDKMAHEARWVLPSAANNFSSQSVLVTTLAVYEQSVTLNGQPISAYMKNHGGEYLIADNYVTWELPVPSNQAMVLKADEGGFSAHVMRLSDHAGASLFNVSLANEPEVLIDVPEQVCVGGEALLTSEVRNDGTLVEPLTYQWYSSSDAVTWLPVAHANGPEWRIAKAGTPMTAWFKVEVCGVLNTTYENICLMSDSMMMVVKQCTPEDNMQRIDTTVCDTLLPYQWRNYEWTTGGVVRDTLIDVSAQDTVYRQFSLHTRTCCPEIKTAQVDSAVCDTLLPYQWVFRDTVLLFDEVGRQEIRLPHPTWTNCTDSVIALVLDTFRCERLYPIIVNKYNWQLLLDYTALSRFFPGCTAKAFQWYKDGEVIDGATEDDYAEQQELSGIYQLRVLLDDDRSVWSRQLEITNTSEPQRVTKRIFNGYGIEVDEVQMRHGVYLIMYRQGEYTWTDKILLP